MATYGQVIEAEPKNAAGFRGRADAYLSLGKQAEAVADYEAALAIDPKNSGVLNNLAWLLATSPDAGPAQRQTLDRAGHAGLRSDRVQAGPHPQHAGRRLCRDGQLRRGHRTGREKAVELGNDQLKGQLSKELRKLPGPQAVARSDSAGGRGRHRTGGRARTAQLSAQRRHGPQQSEEARRGPPGGLGAGLPVHGQRQPAQAHAGRRSRHAGLRPAIRRRRRHLGHRRPAARLRLRALARPARPSARRARRFWPSAAIPST